MCLRIGVRYAGNFTPAWCIYGITSIFIYAVVYINQYFKEAICITACVFADWGVVCMAFGAPIRLIHM